MSHPSFRERGSATGGAEARKNLERYRKKPSSRCCGLVYNPYSDRILDHYTLGKVLGAGAYGQVRAARLKARPHWEAQRIVRKSLKENVNSVGEAAGRRSVLGGAGADTGRPLRNMPTLRNVADFLNEKKGSGGKVGDGGCGATGVFWH